MTAAVLKPLTLTISYESEGSAAFVLDGKRVSAVLKDGTAIAFDNALNLLDGKTRTVILEAETPVILSETDCILFPDGTKLMLP